MTNTVKTITKTLICETCQEFEKAKERIKEKGGSWSCKCSCGQAHVWKIAPSDPNSSPE